ncbi:MAG: exodeoxyribonuclease VII small subunit [Phycisphaerae bacterium]
MARKQQDQTGDAEQKVTFEQALEQLEKIVEQIESGEVSLEESIDKYAQGIKLIKQCRSILDEAERKIQLLSETESGELSKSGELPEPADADEQEDA